MGEDVTNRMKMDMVFPRVDSPEELEQLVRALCEVVADVLHEQLLNNYAELEGRRIKGQFWLEEDE